MNKVAHIMSALVFASIATAAAAAPAPEVCGTASQTEASQLPSTAAVVRLVKDWVDAINTADDAAFVRFVEERGPVLRDGPEQWLQLRNFLRGMTVCGVKSASPDAVEMWVFDPNFDSYGFWGFKPAASEGAKIEFMGGAHGDEVPPGVVRKARLALPALVEAVEARAAQRAADDRFSGAVLVAKDGRVLLEKAYGPADRAAGKANTPETQFRFGSMGKMFTAVSIMQLAEQGKIDLEAPIGRYLPGYPNQDVAGKVTVAHLLSHSGGTGDIFGPEFDKHKAALRSTNDYVDLYGARAPEFAPGARASYSNYGFI
ncbi:MAG TPA: serine hydrolase domain-containing protein, partial [Allosphingosinicella sp.]